ncbi:hypothetical protein C0Z18_05840 [Trinickia dabaoshanensis]|uniref:Uncharacterized protein n=1 Tax=Trinickia dabaoshanensis TaxID=564714 RepID=A0A2N7VY19_9BURK|nr:hypothetical protein C0Z18_05840 [Trinickia dabaoshanensis]
MSSIMPSIFSISAVPLLPLLLSAPKDAEKSAPLRPTWEEPPIDTLMNDLVVMNSECPPPKDSV